LASISEAGQSFWEISLAFGFTGMCNGPTWWSEHQMLSLLVTPTQKVR